MIVFSEVLPAPNMWVFSPWELELVAVPSEPADSALTLGDLALPDAAETLETCRDRGVRVEEGRQRG